MATADEARRELARRELERRRAQQVSPAMQQGMADMSALTQNPAQAAYDQSPWYSQALTAADDIARIGANGLTFGFADKIAGALGGQGTDIERALTGAARERAGSAGTAAEIGGGVASALGLGGSGLTLMGRGAPAAMTGIGGVAARTGIAGLEGAGYGLLEGLGNDRDLGTSAALGALGGGAGNLIGEGIQGIVGAMRGPSARAQEYVANAAGADALDPAMARARLTELGPQGRLADLGPNMRAQASAIATTPGEGQAIVRNTLGERAAGAGQRIAGAVDNTMGAQQGVLSMADDIIAQRRAAAQPLYQRAYATPLQQSDELAELLSRPSAQSALKQAKNNILDRGGSFDLENPTIELIDEVKKALDDVIEPARRAGENGRVSSLTALKNNIVQFADDASPDYAEARRAFSGPTQVKAALEDGQSVFKGTVSPEALSRQLSEMDDASRDAFLIGARQQVADIMGTARNDAQAAKALFAKGYNQEKLNMILGADEAAKLLRQVSAEEAFAGTRNAAIGGSDTAAKARAGNLIAGQSQSDGVLRSLANLRFGDAAIGAVDNVLGGVSAGRNERTNAEIARMLMSADPSLLQPAAQSTAVRDTIARALMGASVGVQ